MIPTVEEVKDVINQLKARKYEIDQESKIVISKIAFYQGQLEVLDEYEKNKVTERSG